MLYCLCKGPYPPTGTVIRQTDFDISIGQCLVSDRNLACAFLIRRKTQSGGEAKVCLLPYRSEVTLYD